MPSLNPKPRSSTKLQHQRLVVAGRKRGLELSEIRAMAGGSIRALSAARCSELITRLTGRGLPHPPGEKPRAYRGKPASGTIRMIQPEHVEQITRLQLEFFDGDANHAAKWLQKNCKVSDPQDLLTAERAGEVIRVLKEMCAR